MGTGVATTRGRFLACVALTALLGPWVIHAKPASARLVPRTIRLEAYVGAAPKDTRLQAQWSVDVEGKSIALQVTRLQIIAGPGTPSSVIEALKPYRRAAFRITGDRRRLEELTSAATGSRIALQGNLRIGPARTLLLDTVEISDGNKG